MLRYGSVCSGIEAASVAWEPLGWEPAWFAEVEPFPSAVLAHHWPDVPNLGDMTLIADAVRAGRVEAPDVLVGGTPCQSFSVAGARKGLEDPRGQLTLAFVDLANAIDDVRRRHGKSPCIIVWENVPGVLFGKENAFGCFLGALCDSGDKLEPAGKRWTNAGAVFGPQRAAAWRTLDAQYFGVAQRRRRVFVVASARPGFDPAEVLFESESVRRDTPPSREAGQGASADAAPGVVGAGRGCFWNGEQVTQTLDAVLHKGQTMPEKNRFPAVVQPAIAFNVHENQRAECTLSTTTGAVKCAGGKPGQGYPAVLEDTARTLTANWHESNGALGGRNEGMLNPVFHGLRVRRLTPVECERLQGFPDRHTNVTYRNRPAFDGPRYKAIGNSMAVPCMQWIGRRVADEFLISLL